MGRCEKQRNREKDWEDMRNRGRGKRCEKQRNREKDWEDMRNRERGKRIGKI